MIAFSFFFFFFEGRTPSHLPAGGTHILLPPEHGFCHTETQWTSLKTAAGSQVQAANRHIFTNDGGTSDITLSPLISFLDFPNESAPRSACVGSKCQLLFFFPSPLCPLPYHLMSHFHVQTSVFGVGVFFFSVLFFLWVGAKSLSSLINRGGQMSHRIVMHQQLWPLDIIISRREIRILMGLTLKCHWC